MPRGSNRGGIARIQVLDPKLDVDILQYVKLAEYVSGGGAEYANV